MARGGSEEWGKDSGKVSSNKVDGEEFRLAGIPYRCSRQPVGAPWHKGLPWGMVVGLGKDYLAGMPVGKIAEKYGIDRRTVLRIRKRIGLERAKI